MNIRFELDAAAVIRERITLRAEDLRYGLDNRFIDPAAVVDLATYALEHGDGDEVMQELACLLSDEYDRVPEILTELDDPERFYDPRDAARKWLYLELAAAYRCRDLLADPLQVVEEIYADFDYPPTISNFVRYMPLQPGDEAGEAALFQRWRNYLDSERKRLASPQ
jgi:hypothetical protein